MATAPVVKKAVAKPVAKVAPKPVVKKEVIGATTRASIKAKAEAGIAMDSTSPEKARLYAQDQARIKYLTQQRARNGERMSDPNAYKEAMYQEERKNLNVNDKAYYNSDNVMLRQGMESEARMGAMGKMLQDQADSSMQSQEAMLGQARDQKILDLKKALDDAVTEGKISVRDAEAQFEDQKGVIEQEAYEDTERTDLTAQDRGIGNSQQMMGMMASDNARKNGLINTNMTTRDRRLNDISDRLNSIKNKSALDTAGANADFGYGMANAQGQVDAQMAQNMFGMHQADMNMTREQQFGLDMAGQQQRNAQQNMAQQQGYTQKNMQTSQNFDLQKMGVEQKNTLTNMAKSFGYDLAKMSKAQQYQLATMAQSFGYDMRLQDDGQSFQRNMQKYGFNHDVSMQNDQQGWQTGMQNDAQSHDSSMQSDQNTWQDGQNTSNRNHDVSMQDDAQSHQKFVDSEARQHDVNMFGKQEASKLAEYDTALKREMASYDSGTDEGKLRIKQLKSAQDALLTETMTKTIGELMGQSFIKKYGEGMTPEQMKKWLADPTNLNHLNTKIKTTTQVPNEKKGFLKMFIDGVKKGTAPGRIYEAYSKAFRDGLPKFTP